MNVQQTRVIGLLPRATPDEFMFQIMNHDRDACPVLKQNKERTREAKGGEGGTILNVSKLGNGLVVFAI